MIYSDLENEKFVIEKKAEPTTTLYPNENFEESKSFGKDPSSEVSDLHIIEKIFSVRNGVILNEKWENSFILSGRVNAIGQNFISCETILDIAKNETEIRKYPKKLFENIPSLVIGKPIKIKINEKAGSFRIDIYDGANTGVEKEFKGMVNWGQLTDFKMDNPDDIND